MKTSNISNIIHPDVMSRTKSPITDSQKEFFLPPLSVNEIIEADVLERVGDRTLLIVLKKAKILADSRIPLRGGEKITVKVEQLHPRVVLRFMQNEKETEYSKLSDYLRYYRSNPKVLYDLFMKLDKVFNQENLGELVSHLGKENIENIQKILESLMISKESLNDKLFLKNYLYKFGYLLEKGIKDSAGRGITKTANFNDFSQNLKALLIKMSDRLRLFTENRSLSAIEKLSGFIDSSIRTIESHQVINYLFQEHEGKYLFQIPILFPEKMGWAEIFIKFENKNSEGRDQQKQKCVMFLLNMDALGDIIVEAKIMQKNIGCILKCKHNELRNFILPFFDELRAKLKDMEYKVDYLECIVDTDILEGDQYCDFHDLLAQEKIDLLV
jgi:hypothetical protein